MLRIIFWLLLLAGIALAVCARWLRMRRRMRGEPEPEQQGPRTVTLVLIAIALVYGLLIAYRLYAGGWSALH